MRKVLGWKCFLTLVTVAFILAFALAAAAADIKPPVFPKDPKTGRYDMKDYDRYLNESNVAIAVSLAKPDHPRYLMALGKAVGVVPSFFYGLYTGATTASDSPFEYLLVPRVCRAINAGKNQILDCLGGSALELVTPGSNVQYAPSPGQLGYLTARSVKRGPIANMLETGALATGPVLAGVGVIAPFAGTCLPGTLAITSTIGGVGGVPVGEVAGVAEDMATKNRK